MHGPRIPPPGHRHNPECDTDGIALPTFCMLGLGSIFFVIQGIMLSNWPIVITNVIASVSSIIIFAIKIHNDRRKKK